MERDLIKDLKRLCCYCITPAIDRKALWAAADGHERCLSRAIELGSYVNYEPFRGLGYKVTDHTPLTAAVEYEHEGCVDILIRAGADVNKENNNFLTPLAIAIKKRHQKIFDILLEEGADVNYQNILGDSALMCAAKYGDDYYIDALIQAGADVNRKNFRLDRPLTTAVINGKFHLAKSLVKAGADMTDRYSIMIWLWEVVLKGETKNIKLLLQAGLNVNMPEVVSTYSIASKEITVNKDGPKVLTKYLKTRGKRAEQEVVMLLYAAGETINKDQVRVPDYLQVETSLKHLCRETIRTHLLQMDPHGNLFHRIPKLEIPLIPVADPGFSRGGGVNPPGGA